MERLERRGLTGKYERQRNKNRESMDIRRGGIRETLICRDDVGVMIV